MSDGKKPKPSVPSGRRRSAARLAAVQALYEMELADAPADPVLRGFIQDRWQAGAGAEEEGGSPMAEPDGELLTDVVRGVSSRRDELDGMIVPALEGKTIEGLQAVLRAILRAATYEFLARTDVPPRVVISEYLEVAKAFFTGPEPGLVNGVLDRLAHVLRGPELEDSGSDKQGKTR